MRDTELERKLAAARTRIQQLEAPGQVGINDLQEQEPLTVGLRRSGNRPQSVSTAQPTYIEPTPVKIDPQPLSRNEQKNILLGALAENNGKVTNSYGLSNPDETDRLRQTSLEIKEKIRRLGVPEEEINDYLDNYLNRRLPENNPQESEQHIQELVKSSLQILSSHFPNLPKLSTSEFIQMATRGRERLSQITIPIIKQNLDEFLAGIILGAGYKAASKTILHSIGIANLPAAVMVGAGGGVLTKYLHLRTEVTITEVEVIESRRWLKNEFRRMKEVGNHHKKELATAVIIGGAGALVSLEIIEHFFNGGGHFWDGFSTGNTNPEVPGGAPEAVQPTPSVTPQAEITPTTPEPELPKDHVLGQGKDIDYSYDKNEAEQALQKHDFAVDEEAQRFAEEKTRQEAEQKALEEAQRLAEERAEEARRLAEEKAREEAAAQAGAGGLEGQGEAEPDFNDNLQGLIPQETLDTLSPGSSVMELIQNGEFNLPAGSSIWGQSESIVKAIYGENYNPGQVTDLAKAFCIDNNIYEPDWPETNIEGADNARNLPVGKTISAGGEVKNLVANWLNQRK